MSREMSRNSSELESGQMRIRGDEPRAARHIVSKEGIAVDLGKIDAIIKSPTPKNVKALGQFLGHLCWYSRMLRHLADFATPLHAVVHRTPFWWTDTEDTTYKALKFMLSQALIVQLPD